MLAGETIRNVKYFKLEKSIVKTNQNIIGEQYVRNDDGALIVCHEDERIAQKIYHEKLLKRTEFAKPRVCM